jgi:hypothetical protein
MALAAAYQDGDEASRAALRRNADFYPISRTGDAGDGIRSIVVRVEGEIFLVEDTSGGETGVFCLLLPVSGC